jgi:molybdopterin-containing oxidoreductase family membrane subunit
LVVAYGYLMEHFGAWYSDDTFDGFLIHNRQFGPYAAAYYALLTCNIAIPQLLWSTTIRRSAFWLFVIALVVNLGMWLERFVIVVTSLHRDYLPSSWGMYYPTVWDWTTLLGSVGLFVTLLLLFIRFLPVISIAEVQEMVHNQATSPEELA